MRKTKINVIQIDGQRYDTLTGEALDGSKPAAAPAHKRSESAKTIPVHTAAASKKPVRRAPAHNQHAHPPASSRTLMRRAVKKPAPSSRLKAHGHTDALARRSLPTIEVKPSLSRLDESRLRHARHVAKSRLISRFSPLLTEPTPRPAPTPAQSTTSKRPPTPKPRPAAKSKHPSTTADLLERALQQANSYQELPPKPRRKLFARRKHVAAHR